MALSLWFPGTVDPGEDPEPGGSDEVPEPVTDPKILAMLEEAVRQEEEDPTYADFFFAGGSLAEGGEIGRYMRADGGRVVDDEQVSATLRIVLVEPRVTGRFPGAPPVQSVITELVDEAERTCEFIESHVTT